MLLLQEVQVDDEDVIQQLMEHSNANRSTGSTGANSESSRSHSIMQVRNSWCIHAHRAYAYWSDILPQLARITMVVGVSDLKLLSSTHVSIWLLQM